MGPAAHRSSSSEVMWQQLRIRWQLHCGAPGKRYRKLALLSLIIAVLFFGSKHWNNGPPRRLEPMRLERHCQDPAIDAPAKPLIVMVSGGSRTGTTFLYNLLRILLRQRDPNTISGWFEDLSYAAGRYASPDPPSSPVLDPALRATHDVGRMWSGALDPYLRAGTTVLVKVHGLAYSTRLFAGCDGPEAFAAPDCPVDLVLYSTRHLCSQIASIRRMGWGSVVDRREILSDPTEFCRKQKNAKTKKGADLSDEDWQKEDTWVDQALGIAACNKEWIEAVGTDKLLANVPMEGGVGLDLVERLVRRIREAGGDDDLASVDNKIFRMNAETALAEANALRPLACSSHIAVNPITHLHRGHVVTSRSAGGVDDGDGDGEKNDQMERDEEDKQRGCAAIDASPELRKFVKG